MWIVCISVTHIKLLKIKNTYISSPSSTDDTLKPLIRLFFQKKLQQWDSTSPLIIFRWNQLFFSPPSLRPSAGWEVLSKARRVWSAGRSCRGRETWNKCEIKIEHDEAGKRPWKQAPHRPGALRPGSARRLANRCEKVQPRGPSQ